MKIMDKERVVSKPVADADTDEVFAYATYRYSVKVMKVTVSTEPGLPQHAQFDLTGAWAIKVAAERDIIPLLQKVPKFSGLDLTRGGFACDFCLSNDHYCWRLHYYHREGKIFLSLGDGIVMCKAIPQDWRRNGFSFVIEIESQDLLGPSVLESRVEEPLTLRSVGGPRNISPRT